MFIDDRDKKASREILETYLARTVHGRDGQRRIVDAIHAIKIDDVAVERNAY